MMCSKLIIVMKFYNYSVGFIYTKSPFGNDSVEPLLLQEVIILKELPN